MAKKEEKKPVVQPKPEIKLNAKELGILSRVLFNSQWNGQQWQGTITPLINKLAQMIDRLK